MKASKRIKSDNPQQPVPLKSSRNPMGYSPFSGGTVKAVAVVSGIPLTFEPDDEGIFKYLGEKDITDMVDQPGEHGAFVLSLFDGRNVRSTTKGAKFRAITWTVGSWYYIHCECLLAQESGRNPMKDFTVSEIGIDGQTVDFKDPRYPEVGPKVTLNDEFAVTMNFTKLNYPAPE